MLALMDERARASSLPGKFRKTGSWNGFSGVAVATKDWPPLRGGHWRKQLPALVLALEKKQWCGADRCKHHDHSAAH